MNIIKKAKEFASHVHRDHVRNNKSKTPYVFHLEEVAELVKTSGGTNQEIAAAWLHDTVEDTPTTMEDIRREFGEEVAHIVEGVTDLVEWLPLPLQERKAKQAERVAQESASIRRIKLADQSSNVKIVGKGDLDYTMEENFIYIESARKIAKVCTGVSPYLDKLFDERFKEAFENLTLLQKKLP